eukprot:Sdes_comp19533_c0_seq2m11125
MGAVGICGSDVHYWKHGKIGTFILEQPMIMGHESAGTVVKVGSQVTSLRVGDRVAVEPGIPCRLCSYCKSGTYNLCAQMKFCATPPVHGSLRNMYCHPADFCFRLPDHISLEEGAFLEPLSVGVHACRRGGVHIGSTVLICGAGPIGLVCLMVAKASGASTVIMTDLDEKRLEMAKRLGAHQTIKVETSDGKIMASKIKESLSKDRQQVNITIECSGAEASIHTAIHATSPGGCIVLVGMGKNQATLPILEAVVREIDIRGVFRYANAYPAALSLISSGAVDVKPLITHRFGMKDFLKAFQVAQRMEDGCIKVMIDPRDSS